MLDPDHVTKNAVDLFSCMSDSLLKSYVHLIQYCLTNMWKVETLVFSFLHPHTSFFFHFFFFVPSAFGSPLVYHCPLMYCWSAPWYVHFASLFYIIICIYSLIYFILWHITYIILSYFAHLVFSGNYLLESRNSGKKTPIKTPVLWRPKNSRKFSKLIFMRLSHGARRWDEGVPPGVWVALGRGSTLGRGWDLPLISVAPPAHLRRSS